MKQKCIDIFMANQEMNEIINVLKFNFDNQNFNIKHNIDNTIIVVNVCRDETCLELQLIGKNTVYIELLQKCESMKGSKLLQIMNYIAMSNEIVLFDESYLILSGGVRLDLAMFKILTQGISWYNQYGYVSQTHEIDIQKNRALLNMNFEIALRRVNPDPSICSGIVSLFGVQTGTVKECVGNMMNSINQEKDNNETHSKNKLLRVIVKLLSKMVSYNKRLIKRCH
jgi:hypothetical protein